MSKEIGINSTFEKSCSICAVVFLACLFTQPLFQNSFQFTVVLQGVSSIIPV
jgi:hypothetical protein